MVMASGGGAGAINFSSQEVEIKIEKFFCSNSNWGWKRWILIFKKVLFTFVSYWSESWKENIEIFFNLAQK